MPNCALCGSSYAPFVCTGCRQEWYCSIPCQKKHWNEHKSVCKKAANREAEVSGATPNKSRAEKPGAKVKASAENAEVDAGQPFCWICLESCGELLRGCACRGTAGYVFVGLTSSDLESVHN